MEWATISELATAFGTVLLSVATFMSVRSANRSARAAERSVLAGLRPLLLTANLQDLDQKVGFQDEKWFKLPGGAAIAEVGDSAIYLAISLRNAASGIAVLHGWHFTPGLIQADEHPGPDQFTRLTRDLYIAGDSVGFWQGTFRDPGGADFDEAATSVRDHGPFTIHLLYGDQDGGQRVITRFLIGPRIDGEGWVPSTVRHWNVDRPDPR